MNSIVIILVSLAFANAAVVDSQLYQNSADLNLLNFMSRSNGLLQENPTRSMECFNYYIPLINEIAAQYETDYKACLNDSAVRRSKVEETTLEQRNTLAQRSKKSCDFLSSCRKQQSASKIFECYVNEGTENSKIMYNISSDASVQLADLKEQLRLIENQESKCTGDVKRIYEKESEQAYNDMNNCLLGITGVSN